MCPIRKGPGGFQGTFRLFFLSPPQLQIFTCKFFDHIVYIQTKATTNIFGLHTQLRKPLVTLIYCSSCEMGGGRKMSHHSIIEVPYVTLFYTWPPYVRHVATQFYLKWPTYLKDTWPPYFTSRGRPKRRVANLFYDVHFWTIEHKVFLKTLFSVLFS